MKKLGVVLGLAVGVAVPSVQAALEVTPFRNFGNYTGNNGGGEFEAVPSADLSFVMANYAAVAKNSPGPTGTVPELQGFQTFCIEKGTDLTAPAVTPGTTYLVALNTAAVTGGVGGGSPDPLSKGTAWLYSQFAAGTLAGYNYVYSGPDTTVGSRAALARALQDTIWFLEDESADPGAGNTFRNAVWANFGGEAGAKANATGADLLNVQIMNLTKDGALFQDMLVVVPEPTTMIVGALLLLPFAGTMLRRMREAA